MIAERPHLDANTAVPVAWEGVLEGIRWLLTASTSTVPLASKRRSFAGLRGSGRARARKRLIRDGRPEFQNRAQQSSLAVRRRANRGSANWHTRCVVIRPCA